MDVLLDLIVSVLGVGIALAFVWAMRFHFSSPKTPAGAWVVAISGAVATCYLVWLNWLGGQPLLARAVGIAVELGSVWLFIAAINASRSARLRFVFDPAHPHTLVDSGPYRLVRHPFYVSYLLFYLGFAIATWHIGAIVVPPVFVALYAFAARMEERNFAASPLATAYADYKARVGFLFPRLR